jgi:hypothetical protein
MIDDPGHTSCMTGSSVTLQLLANVRVTIAEPDREYQEYPAAEVHKFAGMATERALDHLGHRPFLRKSGGHNRRQGRSNTKTPDHRTHWLHPVYALKDFEVNIARFLFRLQRG